MRRRSGLLPPVGLRKDIGGGEGRLFFLGIPVARFRVSGDRLVYRRLPIRDELIADADGVSGRARMFGIPFCTFVMRRMR